MLHTHSEKKFFFFCANMLQLFFNMLNNVATCRTLNFGRKKIFSLNSIKNAGFRVHTKCPQTHPKSQVSLWRKNYRTKQYQNRRYNLCTRRESNLSHFCEGKIIAQNTPKIAGFWVHTKCAQTYPKSQVFNFVQHGCANMLQLFFSCCNMLHIESKKKNFFWCKHVEKNVQHVAQCSNKKTQNVPKHTQNRRFCTFVNMFVQTCCNFFFTCCNMLHTDSEKKNFFLCKHVATFFQHVEQCSNMLHTDWRKKKFSN